MMCVAIAVFSMLATIATLAVGMAAGFTPTLLVAYAGVMIVVQIVMDLGRTRHRAREGSRHG